jgi:hypothetical protein
MPMPKSRLTRADTHLLVGEAGEGPLRRRHLVAADGGRVHGGVLLQEQVTDVHVVLPGCPTDPLEHGVE